MARTGSINQCLVLTSTASMLIARETAFHGELETGGLLLGRSLPSERFLVTKATDGGENAQRSHSSFSPDVRYLNEQIKHAERNGLHFIGEWHRHPRGLDSPSGGDLRTIGEIMEDNGLAKFLALIVLVSESGNTELYPYLVRRSEAPQGLSYRIIDDREVDDLMPWFMTNKGKEHLKKEAASMARGSTHMTLRKNADNLFWIGNYEAHDIELLYPTEYPTVPIDIRLTPDVPSLAYESPCYYATLAATLARLRIDRRYDDGDRGIPIEVIASHWYDTEKGKTTLREIMTDLRKAFPGSTILKLSDGTLTFNCNIDNAARQKVTLTFPEKFPEDSPTARAYNKGQEVQVKQLSMKRWQTDPSIPNLIRYVRSQLRE